MADATNPSIVRAAETPPLLEITIGEAFDAAVARWPSREALVSVHQNIRWSYAELGRRVDQVARALLGLDLAPGDRVGIWSPNCAEWAIAQFATAKAGLILVNINPAYRTEEVAFTLDKVGVKALITAHKFKTSDYCAMLEELAPEIAGAHPMQLRSVRLPHLRTLILIGHEARPGYLPFAALYEIDGAALPKDLSNRDAVNIQFTSGTTGLPKGATLSHRNILNNAVMVGSCMGLREADRLCIPVPLYHCFGMVMGNLACIGHGATMIYPAPQFEPGATLAALERERCTHLHGVPTMFIAMLQHPDFDKANLESLRGGIMAGSPCPAEVMRKVIERMHMREVTIAYGMTETSPVSFQSGPGDPESLRVSTVGRIQPHLEAKIVDESGHTVPRGIAGEICVRGYSVMLGYWDDAEKTAEVVDSEGWMHTGDLGTIDDGGYCRIVGRLKDMIIRGGENIYPREIEEFLFTHPKIEEVQIVGIPDARFGEEACACVRLVAGVSADAEEIRAFCRGRIAHYKVPRHVHFVDSFPLTVTGKVQKFRLREIVLRAMEG
jgi:fatty-acyl-CoA synthase